MKKIFLLILMYFVINSSPAYAQEAGNSNYDSIYNNLPVLEFNYDNEEDPDETLDYQDYIKSPYPLIRISQTLRCKNIKIIPGYYLIKHDNKDGYDVMMFKQNGKIAAFVPIYEKQQINTEIVYPKPEEVKESAFKKAVKAPANIAVSPFKKFFNNHKKPPAEPRRLLETKNAAGGAYFEIWLYEEDYVYKMVFKVEG